MEQTPPSRRSWGPTARPPAPCICEPTPALLIPRRPTPHLFWTARARLALQEGAPEDLRVPVLPVMTYDLLSCVTRLSVLHSPKSDTLSLRSAVSSRFAGFRSRWMIGEEHCGARRARSDPRRRQGEAPLPVGARADEPASERCDTPWTPWGCRKRPLEPLSDRWNLSQTRQNQNIRTHLVQKGDGAREVHDPPESLRPRRAHRLVPAPLEFLEVLLERACARRAGLQ
jgi:hypothetical protein